MNISSCITLLRRSCFFRLSLFGLQNGNFGYCSIQQLTALGDVHQVGLIPHPQHEAYRGNQCPKVHLIAERCTAHTASHEGQQGHDRLLELLPRLFLLALSKIIQQFLIVSFDRFLVSSLYEKLGCLINYQLINRLCVKTSQDLLCHLSNRSRRRVNVNLPVFVKVEMTQVANCCNSLNNILKGKGMRQIISGTQKSSMSKLTAAAPAVIPVVFGNPLKATAAVPTWENNCLSL